jgi:biotin carboxyl carrier protein
MEYEFTDGQQKHCVRVDLDTQPNKAYVNGKALDIDACSISEHGISLIINGDSYQVNMVCQQKVYWLHLHGRTFRLTPVDEEYQTDTIQQGEKGHEGKLAIKAPMPGCVLKIHVREGEIVEEGTCLAILEAMKMETGLHAAIKGRVKKVHVGAGEQVDAGKILVELEQLT